MDRKVFTVVGNRPQFIKMAPVSAELKARGFGEVVAHTGQHYDTNLSDIFFKDMGLPRPDFHLQLSKKGHGATTAEILTGLEEIFLSNNVGKLLIYGDTNSTLAAALAAVKLHIPIAHVESGPRIYDINTPEEINRIVADHASMIRFCTDRVSVQNLKKESIVSNVYQVGDVMLDSFLAFSKKIDSKEGFLKKYCIDDDFVLLTAHRPNNVDSEASLRNLLKIIKSIRKQVFFPVHPRTMMRIKSFGLLENFQKAENLRLAPSLGYLDIISALLSTKCVITDSGGLQKEAFFAGKMCYVCFYETPWPQLLQSGWQKLCGTFENCDVESLCSDIFSTRPPKNKKNYFGFGDAGKKIVDVLEKHNFFY